MEDLIIANEDVIELIIKTSKITGSGYDDSGDYSLQSLINAFEDLINECEHLQDEIEETEQDIKDNYKPISKYEEIGYKERDFL